MPHLYSRPWRSFWHPEQRAVRHRDGSATLSLQIPGFDEALAWVTRWVSETLVLAPVVLSTRARKLGWGMGNVGWK